MMICDVFFGDQTIGMLSGKITVCYWTWMNMAIEIVDVFIDDVDVP